MCLVSMSLLANLKNKMADGSMVKTSEKLYRILAFGDSITAGKTGVELNEAIYKPYTIRLSKLLRDNHPDCAFKVDNSGICGELVCGEMAERLLKVLHESGPYDLVIILGGTNDIIEAKKGLEDTLFEGITNLHTAVVSHGAKVIALTIPETDLYFKDLRENGLCWVKEEGENIRLLVNEKLRESIGRNEENVHITLCDFAVKFPQQSLCDKDLQELWSDGLHFTEKGYSKMAEIIYEDMKHLFTSRMTQRE